MGTKFGKLLDSLHASFWFIPTLMVGIAILLSLVTIGIDQRLEADIISDFGWAYALGPNGSRAILSAIAGSMVTVATTAFSITIVALQLASSQFGPRLLRNFIQDTGNQIVLGTFISTFVYSLLVLRTINGVAENEFVPHIAVTCGIGMAIASIGVLIYFIHHSAISIQVDHVISEVGNELEKVIDRLFPKQIGRGASEHRAEPLPSDVPADFDRKATAIQSTSSNYVQAIDTDQLMQVATEANLLLQLQHRPGDFVIKGSPLVAVYPIESVGKKLVKQINNAFVLGAQRTDQQDVEFSINQLVEISVRALSPGINDPFTAIRCIDQLSAALCHLAQREVPSAYRYDDQNQLRVIAKPVTFADIMDTAFNQIRQYGRTSVAVMMRLLEAIAVIAPCTHIKADRAALLHHANMIEHGSQKGITEESDRKDVKERYLAAIKAIGQV
ncbi:MAG: putative membrane protein [Phormidesmis priestleyi Ana]|uniref:Putative membrane protein n=1 Tax=Phormidesmis priestleyi Ana TaxID=1666911 RepID=A0A0P8BBY8_9CYAN|nr:MAG: putative membrane protein [Phormidesmis priestleyi Ana]